MIEGGKSTEVVVVRGNFTGIERNVKGVAFQLKPASPGARFPVHVVVDKDYAKPVVVTGEDWYEAEQFEELRIDVSPSGGRVNDEWKLFIRPTRTDNRTQQMAVDEYGQVLTRNAPPVVIWETTLSGEVADGTYYLPSKRTNAASSLAAGDVIDISAYRYVKLAVWLYNGIAAGTYVAQTIAAFLDMGDSPDLWPPADEIPAGSTNQFATEASATTPRAGHIVVGEVSDAGTSYSKRVGDRYSYTRAKLVFQNGPTEIDGDVFVQLLGYP
jgi:hypothetical protein